MESERQIPSPSAIFSFFLFLFMAVCIFWRSKSKNSKSKLPPGPPKVPILGNMHQIGEVSSPEMAKQVMKTHDIIFADRPYVIAADIITYGSKSMSFSQYGSSWRQMRKISTFELLTPKRVESFRPIREEEVSKLVKEKTVSEGSVINLAKKINSMAYGLTARIAFGAQSKDQEAYIGHVKEDLKLIGGFSLADLYPSREVLQVLTGLRSKAEKVHQELDRILGSI